MTFYIKEGDTSPAIKYELQDGDGDTVDLSGFEEVKFNMRKENNNFAKISDDTDGNVSVPDPSDGTVEYQWKEGDTENPGSYEAEFEVTFSGGKVETFPNRRNIQVEITEEIG